MLAPAFAHGGYEFKRGERYIMSLINEERAKRNLEPLRWDERLGKAGRRHSQHLDRHGDWHHSKSRYAEIVCEADSHSTCLTMWMNSPSHRQVLLSKRARTLGAGNSWEPGDVISTVEFA